jgi:hypothetical protein
MGTFISAFGILGGIYRLVLVALERVLFIAIVLEHCRMWHVPVQSLAGWR